VARQPGVNKESVFSTGGKPWREGYALGSSFSAFFRQNEKKFLAKKN